MSADRALTLKDQPVTEATDEVDDSAETSSQHSIARSTLYFFWILLLAFTEGGPGVFLGFALRNYWVGVPDDDSQVTLEQNASLIYFLMAFSTITSLPMAVAMAFGEEDEENEDNGEHAEKALDPTSIPSDDSNADENHDKKAENLAVTQDKPQVNAEEQEEEEEESTSEIESDDDEEDEDDREYDVNALVPTSSPSDDSKATVVSIKEDKQSSKTNIAKEAAEESWARNCCRYIARSLIHCGRETIETLTTVVPFGMLTAGGLYELFRLISPEAKIANLTFSIILGAVNGAGKCNLHKGHAHRHDFRQLFWLLWERNRRLAIAGALLSSSIVFAQIPEAYADVESLYELTGDVGKIGRVLIPTAVIVSVTIWEGGTEARSTLLNMLKTDEYAAVSTRTKLLLLIPAIEHGLISTYGAIELVELRHNLRQAQDTRALGFIGLQILAGTGGVIGFMWTTAPKCERALRQLSKAYTQFGNALSKCKTTMFAKHKSAMQLSQSELSEIKTSEKNVVVYSRLHSPLPRPALQLTSSKQDEKEKTADKVVSLTNVRFGQTGRASN